MQSTLDGVYCHFKLFMLWIAHFIPWVIVSWHLLPCCFPFTCLSSIARICFLLFSLYCYGNHEYVGRILHLFLPSAPTRSPSQAKYGEDSKGDPISDFHLKKKLYHQVAKVVFINGGLTWHDGGFITVTVFSALNCPCPFVPSVLLTCYLTALHAFSSLAQYMLHEQILRDS